MPKESPKKKSKSSKKVKSYLVKDYLSDLHKNGMLYAALVRSPYSSGKITNIDISILPEEYSLYTAREVPGSNIIKTFSTETEVFCTSEVHYKGEPIGILTGPDLKGVRKWAKKIPVIFDFSRFENAAKEISKSYIHPVINIEEAKNPDYSTEGIKTDDLLHKKLKESREKEETILEDRKNKIEIAEDDTENKNQSISERLFSLPEEKIIAERIFKSGFFSKLSFSEDEEKERNKAIEDFFKTFAYDIRGQWEYKDNSPLWTETSGALCATENGSLNIYLPTQWPSHLEKSVKDVISISDDKIEIRKTLSQSKNQNGTWRSILLASQAAVASVLSGKSVKLMLSREEQREYMKNSLDTAITMRTAVNQEGKITTLMAEIRADAGYQNPFAQEIADRLTIALVNMYSPENIYIETKIFTTDLPPTSISQEKLDSASYFASESQLMLISKKTGLFPDELRLLNIQQASSPFKFKNLKFTEAINAIVSQSDFKRKFATYNSYNSYDSKAKDSKVFFSLAHRGIGLSTGLDGTFFLGTSLNDLQQKIEVTLEHDGSVKISAPIPSLSIADIWKKIVSENLGIESSQIQISTDTENLSQSALPEGFSSNISVMTNLLKKCCQEIQKKRFQVPLPISAKKVTSPAIKKAFNKKTFTGSPFYATAFGSAIIELETDPYTYKIRIRGIWVAIDCGELLSIKDAENTVRLAIQQELDELVAGERLTSECTKINFVISQNPPCQLGELIHDLIPGAFASALSQAMGSSVKSLPCTSEELYELSLHSQNPEKMEKEEEKINEDTKESLEENEISQTLDDEEKAGKSDDKENLNKISLAPEGKENTSKSEKDENIKENSRDGDSNGELEDDGKNLSSEDAESIEKVKKGVSLEKT
ncbi:MAG: xanthine dehydrogenase family protein molybdopterin-binding subunit [Treponema sp.]|nr:xanthine dehydrogenase family protein molybdopterin-binding subunit [Treponema sp.]